jgi:hypothetical protein
MERDREQVRQEIEETKEAMAEKLEEITERVDEARTKLRGMRQRFNLRHQMREHPWMVLGLSMAAGYTLYRVFHTGGTERAVASALEGVRGTARQVKCGAEDTARMAREAASGAARKAREGTEAVRETFGSSLTRGALDAASRAVMTTVGGMLLGAIVNRLSSKGEGRMERHRGEEVLYEQAATGPATPSVRPGPIMG